MDSMPHEAPECHGTSAPRNIPITKRLYHTVHIMAFVSQYEYRGNRHRWRSRVFHDINSSNRPFRMVDEHTTCVKTHCRRTNTGIPSGHHDSNPTVPREKTHVGQFTEPNLSI